MRTWDNALDEKILQVIETNDGKTYFYHLEKELGISRKTLNEHLKKLETQEIIQKDENPQTGKKRYIRLTPKAILKKSLDILEGVVSKNVTMRHKKLVLLLLIMLGQSYAGHEYRSDGSMINKVRRPGPRLVSELTRPDPGISLDIAINRSIFSHIVDDFSPEEITDSINKLRKQKIFVPTSLPTGDIYFRFDESYGSSLPFIIESYHILDILLGRMTFNWLRVSRKATPKEIDWFIFIVSKHETKNFFIGLDEERKLSFENAIELNKKWLGDSFKAGMEKAILTQIKKHDKQHVQECDLSIKKMIQKLQNKYHDIEKQHPVFYELIMEMINPSFLH